MKWTYVIRQKLKIALILAVVSLILVGTNLIDKQHFSNIQHSFNSVYKDRLLVESYIYEISSCFHQKKMLFDNGFVEGDRHFNTLLNDSIDALLSLYGKTVLTTSESRYFNDLKFTFHKMRYEELAGGKGLVSNETPKKHLDYTYNRLNVILHELSEIQKSESKKVLEDTNRMIASSGITSQFEIVIIILIGLICQILIFASKAVKTSFTQKEIWN